jgi:hypothetical protein
MSSALAILGVFWCVIVNFNISFIFSSLLSFVQLFFDVFANFLEYLLNVDVILCAALNKFNVIFLGQSLSLFISNLTIFLAAIRFISNYYFAHVLGLSFVYLLEPILDVIESFSIGN